MSSGISMQDTCSVFGVRCSILPTRTAKNTSLEKKKRLEVQYCRTVRGVGNTASVELM